MRTPRAASAVWACALLFTACGYIVFPEEEKGSRAGQSEGWSAQAVGVGATASGDLSIELAIRNDTADWSAMEAAKKPAVLVAKNGRKTSCDGVFVGTGGHRLAPGFRMRGYLAGKKLEPRIEPVRVECKGAKAGPGAKLLVEYAYVTGQYNYYNRTKNPGTGTFEIDLDKVDQHLTYPVAEPVKDLIIKSDTKLVALNEVTLSLASVARSAQGIQFTWRTSNPGEYPCYVHVGTTPVIGRDGILYGFYETPDIVSVPITPGNGTAEWTSKVAVPADVKGIYVMLSVETGKQRLFANYAVDISHD
jgi:hypothetical protein